MNKRWQRWERVRARGERDYVWRYGVFGFGGVACALTLLSLLWRSDTPVPLWVAIPLDLVLWPVGGYFLGKYMWQYAEAEYRAARSREDSAR